MGRREAALGALGIGLVVIIAARMMVPTAPPLYDGVVPIEAYRWLDPPPGQHGGAKGATAQIPVPDGRSPLVAVATPELEPQAQIFAPPGGLTLPAGARLIKVSIEPVPTEGVPADGHFDGNVYRLTVTDQDGTPLLAPASARVSVVIRAADPNLVDGTIAQFTDGSWVPLTTRSTGFGGSFLSVVTAFGDFAVIAPGAGPSLPASATPAAGPVASPSDASTPVASARPTVAGGPSTGSESGGAGLPGWLLPGLAAVAIAIVIVGYRTVTRGRRRRYRGAHRTRRH